MGNRPIQKYRAGQLEVAIWFNEKKLKDDTIVGFKTASLRKSWRDEEGVWRDAVIQLRKHDIAKVAILMNKAMEELLLSHEEEKEGDEEDE